MGAGGEVGAELGVRRFRRLPLPSYPRSTSLKRVRKRSHVAVSVTAGMPAPGVILMRNPAVIARAVHQPEARGTGPVESHKFLSHGGSFHADKITPDAVNRIQDNPQRPVAECGLAFLCSPLPPPFQESLP